jgi:hypothetical protein
LPYALPVLAFVAAAARIVQKAEQFAVIRAAAKVSLVIRSGIVGGGDCFPHLSQRDFRHPNSHNFVRPV